MNQDIFFVKGKSHTVCEDYGISGQKGSWHYLVASDGCSSSRDTDIGSRLLCLSAQNAIHEIEESFFNEEDIAVIESYIFSFILHKIKELMITLNLRRDLFDATLMIYLTNGSRSLFFIRGDGNLVLRYSDVIELHSFEYESGAPSYLSYDLHRDFMNNYERQFEYPTMMCTTTSFGSMGQGEAKKRYIDNYNFSMELDRTINYESVSIASDGLLTFYNSSQENESIINVLEELTVFPSTKGSFVLRRMRKALKQFNARGIDYSDDLVFGAIHFEKINSVPLASRVLI